MRKIRELLRLKFESTLSTRQLAQSLGISVGSVHDYLARARIAHLSWPLPEGVTDAQLEAQLFPAPAVAAVASKLPPDWKQIDKELKRKGVTRRLLWEEYRSTCPDGLGYSQFCKQFADFQHTLDPRMRQSHKAGEKLFVDYAGMTLPLIDSHTGGSTAVQIFVATLGASSYTYAEATLTQSLPDWIGAHVRAFAFFGGVPELVVCDNLRSGVRAACPYEPDVQRTYQEMAAHYQTAILPTRVKKPRDKAKVEAGVQSVEERVLAPLRDRQFFTLAEINQALQPLLWALNQRQMQGKDHSRADLFAQLERPALRALPAQPYQMGLWSRARVSIDYHIAVDDRYYSVPYQLLKQEVEVRQSGQVVEIFHQGVRITSHARVLQKYARSTYDEHMPAPHKEYAGWTPTRLLEWLQKSGASTRAVGESILARRCHPQQGFRSCLGLIRLGRLYSPERVEAACHKALLLHSPTYKSVKTILQNQMDRLPEPAAPAPVAPVEHDNIRGAHYYSALPQLSGEEPEPGEADRSSDLP